MLRRYDVKSLFLSLLMCVTCLAETVEAADGCKTIFAPAALPSGAETRERPLTRVEGLERFQLAGHERTLRDLEDVFRSLVTGKEFELVIPRNYQFKLKFDSSYSVRHIEKDVIYFPYHLNGAVTSEAKYFHDLGSELAKAIEKIQFLQKTDQPVEWVEFMGMQYRFNASPSTGKNRSFFAHPAAVASLVETVQKIGRPPFMFVDASGAWHLTNQHFLQHLKDRGIHKIKVYRGHSGFDLFFYRALLGKDERTSRTEFADWLRRSVNGDARLFGERNWWNQIISRLENLSEREDQILLEIAGKATTSVMFTSLSHRNSRYWIHPRENSEVLELELDLDALPRSYLNQILTGLDIDVEIVFPFTTIEQIEAMKSALSIVSSSKIR